MRESLSLHKSIQTYDNFADKQLNTSFLDFTLLVLFLIILTTVVCSLFYIVNLNRRC